MFKRFIILLLMILTTTVANAQTTKVLGIKNVAGDTYTDILFFLTFEANDNTDPYDMLNPGAGDGDEYSAGDTSGTYSDGQGCIAGDSCVNTASVKVGTYGYNMFHNDAAWLRMTFAISSGDLADTESGGAALWYRPANDVGSQRVLFRVGTAGSEYIRIIKNASSNDVRIDYFDGTNTCTASVPSAATSATTWYFIEAYWNTVSDTYTVKVTPDGGSTTTSSNGTGTCNTIASATNLSIGTYNTVAAAPAETWVDNVMITNDPTRNLFPLRNNTVSPR